MPLRGLKCIHWCRWTGTVAALRGAMGLGGLMAQLAHAPVKKFTGKPGTPTRMENTQPDAG